MVLDLSHPPPVPLQQASQSILGGVEPKCKNCAEVYQRFIFDKFGNGDFRMPSTNKRLIVPMTACDDLRLNCPLGGVRVNRLKPRVLLSQQQI